MKTVYDWNNFISINSEGEYVTDVRAQSIEVEEVKGCFLHREKENLKECRWCL